MDDTIDDVVIIGAGPAGLTTGYALTRESALRVRLLDSDPVSFGGISRTESYKGFLFDIGGHRFFSKSEDIEALWRELLPQDFLLRPRSSRLHYAGRFYRYPLHAVEVLLNLGFFESCLCLLSYVAARLKPVRPVLSFQDWVSNQFGARLFRLFFKTYTEKVWGLPCDQISADWAAQRIKGLSLTTALWAAVRKSLRLTVRARGGKTVKTLIEEFNYPRRGPGMMWTAAAEKIRAQGGAIEQGVTAETFAWDETAHLWTVTARTAQGVRQSYRARHLVSSAPLSETIPAVAPRPKSAALAAKLSYRSFVVVALMLKASPSFDDNWIYIHDPDLRVGRIQNFTSWSPDMVPAPGLWCLGLEYFCFEDDAFWSQPDEALVALAKEELDKLGLAPAAAVFDGCVVRQKKAYPVYDSAYEETIRAVREEFAARFPTFHFVGRNGMHRYNNQDHAMMTGLLTAKNILAGKPLYDVWAVNEDAAYHEDAAAEASS